MNKKVYVGNLNYAVTSEQLNELFAQAGEIKTGFQVTSSTFTTLQTGSVSVCTGNAGSATHGRRIRG